MLEVKPTGQRSHKKHLPGGCTISVPPSNCHLQGVHIILLHDTLFCSLLFDELYVKHH